MRSNLFAAMVGAFLGVFYGVLLVICVNGFAIASMILYGNPHYLGTCVAVFLGLLSFITVVSYELWAFRVQNAIVEVVEILSERGDLE